VTASSCRSLLLGVVFACGAWACGSASTPVAAPTPPLTNDVPPRPAPPPQNTDIDSHDILAREVTAPSVLVKHVLIAWADLGPDYAGRLDPRAAKRTKADAAKLAIEISTTLRADPSSIDKLVTAHSEDPGSLPHEPYEIKADTPFVPEFKNLGLRLQLGEVGIVTTRFGYHVMIRVTPPPVDPLESADILARPIGAGPVDVQHILIGWEGLDPTKDAIGKQRTKAEADALVTELLAKVRAGADMTALVKQHSEDPGSNANGKPYTVASDSPMVEPFKNLSLRLNENETGLVKTRFGWHVIKRVPPPPPDKLESAAILKRTSVAERVKVKHILLGWKEVHAEDPRGASRTRAELEKLVKATLKKLAKKGSSFEAEMKDLSEDPGSASSGEAYEATPETPMVKPFLNMSLRLKLDEIGIVKTEFGIHIIKRVE
jgi:hypothetical protein